ncbi:hypothetical protein DH2020_005831 [Rehmannia glutinosa]|uniref:Protein kinase domain-containing protein n=1 Tax=Rehmannia glutinosa TaxID=99300 RepID=A0ABR0XH89_REHGL
MPFPLPVVLHFEFKGLILSRTWSEFASGQIATSTGFFHSRKFSIGGFSSLETFFLFLLSIALSEKPFLSGQYTRYKVIKEVGNGTFGSVWRALNKQSGEVECNLYQLMKDRGSFFQKLKYRAPEVLLQSPTYGPPVDMWAMGAIMAELFTLRPLFPGSSEADEIYKICCVIGSPTKSEWTEGLELASAINYQFPQVAGVHLSVLLPGVSEDAISLIKSLCSWNPRKRPTAMEALQHPFFQSCFYVPPSLRSKAAIARTPPPAGTRGVWEQNCGRRFPGSLSNPKPTNSFSSAKPQAPVVAGVQRRLDMNNQDLNKNDKNMKNYVKPQPRYRPPGLNGPPAGNLGNTRGISDAAEKLANMTMGSGRPLAKLSVPPPMKAGGWHGQSELFLGRSQEVIPGRAYNRRVVG